VEGDGGVKLWGVSGHVKKPGLYEFPMGKNLKELIYVDGGGILGDRELKGVMPGGVSTPILLPDEIDLPLTHESLRQAGSRLGTGCAIVIGHGTCMVRVTLRLARFCAHESCGRCTPCREGFAWMSSTIAHIEAGAGRKEDLDLLDSLTGSIAGRTLCQFGDAAAVPIRTLVKKFRHEFEAHVDAGKCPSGYGPEWEG